jgi:hypothetical protein
MDVIEVLQAFAATISREGLHGAQHAPEAWAAAARCFENVLRKIDRSGGAALTGWTFGDRLAPSGGGYLLATHHCVWLSPQKKIIDVTPFHTDERHVPATTPDGTVIFLPDGEATPVRAGNALAPRPIRFFAIGDDPLLREYVASKQRKEDAECEALYARLEGGATE